MSKGKFHVFRLFFAIMVVVAISFLLCQTNIVKETYSILFANAESISYEISQNYNQITQTGETPLYVTSVVVDDREYNGERDVHISSIVVEDGDGNEVSDVAVRAVAKMADPNVGNNKYVEVTNFEIYGENPNNYYISEEYRFPTVLVNILPFGNDEEKTLEWITRDLSGPTQVDINPDEYVYKGTDQRQGIAAYYKNINGATVYLHVNIVCINPYSNNPFLNEFINAGTYEASVILTPEEQNYKIVDSSGDAKLTLVMNKAIPKLNYNTNVYYTYTGELQSLKSYVSLNNTEQTLHFDNYTFKDLNEGKAKGVEVWAEESQNYFKFPYESNKQRETYYVPASNFIKRVSEINVDQIPTEYTYTGEIQRIPHNAVIDDSINNEQTLRYSVEESFINCQKNRKIIIFADETESGNFDAISKSIYININKAVINTSSWRWSPSIFDYDSLKHSVYITNYDSGLVYVNYSNNEKTDAGVYTAIAEFSLRDEDNYEQLSVSSKTITWRINKAQITKPIVEDRKTTYTGVAQQIEGLNSIYYNVENAVNTNAGKYNVFVTLKDINNYEWRDGTTSILKINWEIEKAKVQTPIFSKVVYYTGEATSVQVPTNELYTIIENPQTNVGDYKSYLILNDFQNYQWEDSNSPYLTIGWSIRARAYDSPYSVLSILFLSIFIVLITVYYTLHFTSKARRKRKKKLVAQEVKSVSNLESVQTQAKEMNEQPLSVSKQPQQKETLQSSSPKSKVEKTDKSSQPKIRKKRMLSMKKNDKKERRKKENQKIAKAKRPPAKRGRPPKKVETRGRKPKKK